MNCQEQEQQLRQVVNATLNILQNTGLWWDAYIRLRDCVLTSAPQYHGRNDRYGMNGVNIFETGQWDQNLMTIQQPNLYLAIDRLNRLAMQYGYRMVLQSESEAVLTFFDQTIG